MARSDLSVSRPDLLINGSDKEFRQMVQNLLAISSRMESLRTEIAKLVGVSGPQYSLLAATAHLGGGPAAVTITLLASVLHVSTTYVTAEVGKLVGVGLLQKAPNPKDGRSICISLTPKGRDAMRALLPALRPVNDTIFRNLDKAAFAVLRREIAAMVPALDEALFIVQLHEESST